jgi:hypothetical protein
MRKALLASLLLNGTLAAVYAGLFWDATPRPAGSRRVDPGFRLESGAREGGRPSGGAQAASESPYGIPLRDLISLDAPPAAIALQMRQAGYPPQIVLAVVSEALSRQNGIDPAMTGMRAAFQREGRSAPEVIAFEKLRDRMVEEALQLVPEARAGFEDNVIAELTGTDRKTRDKIKYGELSAASIAAAKEVERHFGRVSDDEYEAKVRAVLSPAEADDYLMFNSQFARRLQANIRAIDIDEQTYRALYARLRAIATPQAPRIGSRGLTAAESEIYREVLGADKFVVAAPQMSYGTVDSSMFKGTGAAGVNTFTAEDVLSAINVVNELKSTGSVVQRQALARETYARFMEKLSNDEERRLFSESQFGKMLQVYSVPREDRP